LAASFGRSGYSPTPRGSEPEDLKLDLDLEKAIRKPMKELYADDAHDTTDHVTLEKLKSMVDKWPDDLNQLATKAHVVEFKRRIECLRDAINAKKEKLAKELKDDIAKTQKEWKDLWLPLQKHYQGDSAAKVEHDKKAKQDKKAREEAYAEEAVRKKKVHEKWVENEERHNAQLAIRRDERKADLEENLKARIAFLKGLIAMSEVPLLIAMLVAEYEAAKARREAELAATQKELQQKYEADVKKIDDQIDKIEKEHAKAKEALEKEVLAPLKEHRLGVEKIKTRIAALTEKIYKDLKEMRERQKLKVEAQCKELEGDIQVKIEERNELFMKYMALEDGHLADIAEGVVTEAKHLPPVDQPLYHTYEYTPRAKIPEAVPPQLEPEPQQ